MSAEKFDVVIIGGGNAGIGVTGPVRRAGLSVAMIESRDLGGTCPNRGCTPKKVLVAAGQALHDIERASVHQIAVGQPKLDWAALIAREKDMIKDIPENLARAMARRKVEVIKGYGTFAGPDTVRVGDRTLHAGHIVIAGGSKPRPLSIPGAQQVMTSDDMLSESKRPDSVIFIGGGVISLEFGHVYARAGSAVTILEALPQLLPAMDSDAVARLQAESERIGLQIRTSVRIKRIETIGERFRVVFTHGDIESVAEADWVVNGAGRIADVDALGLVAGQVDHDNGRIAPDRYLRSTSNPRVYICGDAVPASKGLSTEIHVNDMHDWFSARTYAETVAWSKIIVDHASDRILGAHFVGHAGHELVNIFGLAMKFVISASALREHDYAYPTFASDIKHMLGHA
jgi:glutathione reductase (NADPH)